MSGYRFGAYHDGPDPLAQPYDAGRAVDRIGERVLAGSSVQEAVRDLLRRGPDGRRGLDRLRRQVRERRRALASAGRLDGTLQQVRRLLEQAVAQERQALFPDPSDDARLREDLLAGLPADPARAVRELADYAWRSPQARDTFQQILDLLRRDVLDQQFRGLSRGLSDPGSPQARQRLTEMLADLNDLLDARRRGADTQADFEAFLQRHGDLFPDRPGSLDELLDDLARRAAALQRLLDSLSPEQRAELSGLLEQARQDLDLQAELARLTDSLRALRPDLPWQGRQRLAGGEPMGLPDATQALADLADLAALEEQLGQGYAGATLADVDEDAVRRVLGRAAADDLEDLRAVQRELERQGFLVRAEDRLRLTPKAVRRIGRSALARVFASLTAATRGEHDVRDAGAAGEFTGQTRPWRFGDEQPIDVVRTVGNAVRRGLLTPGAPLRLSHEDVEVRETESRTRAAVALLVDQSWSMVVNGTWPAAKATALALHTLATTAYPADAVQVIAFANLARAVPPHEVPDLAAADLQGTNLQHALHLAGRFLDRHRDAEPVLLVVTDGEPTAHLLDDGDWWFAWPPTRETMNRTVAEVDRLTRRGVTVSWFRLGDDERLAEFLDAMARRNGGRVLAVAGDRLGDYVVSDYVRARRGRRRSA